ncbi:spore coat associated protein CotJA [Anaerocolumna xylanovorans]|uniref:Spore coat associated protein JA (CotJA) n=1 Tax=Anaerocolumna xylanovorans DSM 12503 TaxID=1121345 RepID=A0A1M7Y737_9FIRM|nr:spore coat associated protein CotJA [Anaerocolumna xylanovorans]SHO48439.1 Spore coat associated protein JA (CotJA) [Anaerocolumna xylanovorans DSM 12503]
MDNYRRPMYPQNSRNMGYNQNQQCGCGVTPVLEAVKSGCDIKNGCDTKSGCDTLSSIDKCLDKLPLAMSYVPMQKWRNIYDTGAAMKAGTIFQELDLPFLGAGNMCRGRGGRS